MLPTLNFFFFFRQMIAEAQGHQSWHPRLARQTRPWCPRTSARLGDTEPEKNGRGWQCRVAEGAKVWDLR